MEKIKIESEKNLFSNSITLYIILFGTNNDHQTIADNLNNRIKRFSIDITKIKTESWTINTLKTGNNKYTYIIQILLKASIIL